MQVYQMEPAMLKAFQDLATEPVPHGTQWGPVFFRGCYRSDLLREATVVRDDAPDEWDVTARLRFVALKGKPRFVALRDNAIYAADSMVALLKDSSYLGLAGQCNRVDATHGYRMGRGAVCAVYEIPEDVYREMEGGRALQPLNWPTADGRLIDYGCWKDSQGNFGRDRLFSNKRDNVPKRGAVRECAVEAAKQGAEWFGVEGGNGSNEKECFIETQQNNIVPRHHTYDVDDGLWVPRTLHLLGQG